jgi:hypothetical protein
MSSDHVAETAEQLHRASVRTYINPYEYIAWPERLDTEQWFTSPELVSLYGTAAWDELDEPARKRLSFYEAVNFFSLNIFGERQQMEGLAARLYDPDKAKITRYLHHFLDEENKHNIFFGTFCLKYGGKVYPHNKLSLTREYAPGEEDFLFFAQILIFEEIADRHNLLMAKDERLVPVARQINQVHHLEETRHLRFGRVMVSDLWDRFSPTWGAARVAAVRQHLVDYLSATWLEYYNPAVYRDAGLGGPSQSFAVREHAVEHPNNQSHRRELSAHCLRFLRDSGILVEEPVL